MTPEEEKRLKLVEEALAFVQSPPTRATRTPSQTNKQDLEFEGASFYCPLQFKDAAEFLCFFDPALKKGKKKLYSWQIEELRRLSAKGVHTTESPLEYILLAANGSGKDAYIIAGFVAFVLCCWRRYKVIITSSSDQQLDSQTRNYIKYLCQNVNDYCRQNGILSKAIDIKKETFKASVHKDGSGKNISLTGSEVYTFVTNMGGRAEGHHPFPDADPGEGVILIVNEAKTVPQEIYDHFAKCTYNYFIQVSSAGGNSGHLYRRWCDSIQYPAPFEKGMTYGRRITAYDCPHISPYKLAKELEDCGINDPWFKNTRLSLFSSFGDSLVITEELLDKCLQQSSRHMLGLGRRGGLDLSGRGNDFNTFYVIEDNELIAFERWRASDTENTVDILCGTGDSLGMFAKYGFNQKDASERISADDNGIGAGIVDGLARKGWNVRRVLNQSSAINNQRYLNRGAEMWFSFARIIEGGYFHVGKKLLAENKWIRSQLTNRHYTQEGQGKLKLWKKSEEKAGAKGKIKGNYVDDESDSPDDADALILAFSTLSIHDFLGKTTELTKVPQTYPTTNQIIQAQRPAQRQISQYFKEAQRSMQPRTNNIVDTLRTLY